MNDHLERIRKLAISGDEDAYEQLVTEVTRRGENANWLPAMPALKEMWERGVSKRDLELLQRLDAHLNRISKHVYYLRMHSQNLVRALRFFLDGHAWIQSATGKKWHVRRNTEETSLCGREMLAIATQPTSIAMTSVSRSSCTIVDACGQCIYPYNKLLAVLSEHYDTSVMQQIVFGADVV